MKFDSPSNQPWGIVKDGFIRCSWNRLVNSRNFSINTVNQMINTIHNHFIFSYSSKEIRGSENRIVFFSNRIITFTFHVHVYAENFLACGRFHSLFFARSLNEVSRQIEHTLFREVETKFDGRIVCHATDAAIRRHVGLLLVRPSRLLFK